MKIAILLSVVLLVGCARFQEYRPIEFDPSQCTESYKWQGMYGTRGLFESTITCKKTYIPPLTRVEDLEK